MKISIIGAGNVGGLTAMQLALSGIEQIMLIDIAHNLAQAKSLDLNDARFILKKNYFFQGSDDINQISGSDIIIITAGLPRKPGMSREQLLQKNGSIIKALCEDIKRLCPNSIIIVVTNPLDAMTYLTLKETAFPKQRVLGMGLTLDCSRLANLISKTIGVKVTKIEPCIIGSHGQKMLPLSRFTKIGGVSLNKHLAPEKTEELFKAAIHRGAEIVSLLGSGSAYFAPSAAIAELAKAIVQDAKIILPVSAYLNGEYGLNNLCIGVPCCLGKQGIEKIIELELNSHEKEAFLKSAESIKQQISAIYN